MPCPDHAMPVMRAVYLILTGMHQWPKFGVKWRTLGGAGCPRYGAGFHESVTGRHAMTRTAGSRYLRYLRSWPFFTVSLAAAALAAVQLTAAPGAALAASAGTAAGLRVQPVGNLDCNGYSPIQRPVKPGGIICAEVHSGSEYGQLYDNGHYIGHDEPTVQFYS